MNVIEIFHFGFSTFAIFSWLFLMTTMASIYTGHVISHEQISSAYLILFLWIFPLLGMLMELFSEEGFLYEYLLPKPETFKRQ